MTKISIAIPTYEMGGRGGDVLAGSFYILAEQNFQDFNVIISDHSIDDRVYDTCYNWRDFLNIRYYRNEKNRGSASANTNISIEKSNGEWIKLLCQDDFLYNKDSLKIIADRIDSDNPFWLATAYYHSDDAIKMRNLHYPLWNDQIYIINTIGTPSCVAIKNMEDLPKIDENLSYAYDCEWYYQLWKKYGEPSYINQPTMVNRLWENSISSSVSPNLIQRENEYILRKYGFIK